MTAFAMHKEPAYIPIKLIRTIPDAIIPTHLQTEVGQKMESTPGKKTQPVDWRAESYRRVSNVIYNNLNQTLHLLLVCILW